MTTAPRHDSPEQAVKVLSILLLLAATTLASSDIAATNSGSDWLNPAREANTQIPFPQRDLHLRSVDSAIRFGSPPENQPIPGGHA